MPGNQAGKFPLFQSPRQERWILPAVIVLLALGVLVRILYAFPIHKFVPDADSLNMGLRALAIRGGDLVVFFSGVQIGALEAYLHVPLFALFGASRATLSVVPIVCGCLVPVVFYLFVRDLFDSEEIACLSLLFVAFPSPAYLAWTYMPNSYPETVLIGITTLWLTARIARLGSGGWTPFALGISIGLGWWNSLLTLGATLPALAWLLVFHRDKAPPRRLLLPLAGGFVLGAAPWIYYNARYRLATFWINFAPAEAGTGVLSTAGRFFRETAVELVAGLNPLGPARPVTPLEGFLRVPAAGLVVVSLLLLPAASLLALRARRGARKGIALLGLVAATVAALFIFSAAGQAPGPTVRYVLPLAFVVAAALGLLVAAVSRRSRPAAAVLAGVVLTFHLSGYYWPWTSERREWAQNLRSDQALLAFLEGNGVRWVCGGYWTVYPVNFLSGGRIRAVPFERQFDFYGYGRNLPAAAGKLALLGRDERELALWAERAGLRGRPVRAAPGYVALLPAVDPRSSGSSQRLLAELTAAARQLR
jgi:4-amino-4-deoxy-L-arabinose transferase-like glycosyltransferase